MLCWLEIYRAAFFLLLIVLIDFSFKWKSLLMGVYMFADIFSPQQDATMVPFETTLMGIPSGYAPGLYPVRGSVCQ